MKKLLLFFALFITSISGYSQVEDTATVSVETIEKSMKYEIGKIKLAAGNGTLNVPKGFKFLNAEQSQYVLKDLWGNPEDKTILGALVPENKGVLQEDSWLFTINYDGMGFVKDDDAEDIDYDEMLDNIKAEIKKDNPERIQQGFPSYELIGWASKPYYDKDKKVLHWAKEIKFGTDSINTLNYDLRVLGRKGVYILSAVANIKQLPEVKGNINNVISSIEFDKGEAYSDFDSNTDTIAAWTIGGLVAGKVLAKVGFFAIILKFGKFIALGLIAAWAAVKKFFFGKKDQEVSRPQAAIAEEATPPQEEI
ncbi:MAG: DUF2167 domain-containing protein [Flavobacterium sp.]|nr:DUF2167 domain-containing protein [Flavobacterium sp.]